MPAMPAGCEDGILKGLYKFKPGAEDKKIKAHIFGSGSIMQSALKAQEILAEKYDVSADVWSATSYKLLRTDAIRCQRWNMLHPTQPPQKSYVETLLAKEKGVFVSVSDNIRTVADQIAPWVPGGLFTLGTDGFGRSDTRERLRRFFGVDVNPPSSARFTPSRKKARSDAKWSGRRSKTSALIPKKSSRRLFERRSPENFLTSSSRFAHDCPERVIHRKCSPPAAVTPLRRAVSAQIPARRSL